MVEYSYSELVEQAKNARTRQRRSQLSLMAEEKYPDIYKIQDFTKRKYRYKTYKEMVELYNEEADIMTRCTIKRKAERFHPKEFKEEDFLKLHK